MRTDKQIAASRANGARSRGRKSTPTAFQQGGYGMLARAMVREGESRRGFQELVEHLTGFLQPESSIDHLLIGKMVVAHWRQTRLWYHEKEKGESLGAAENRFDRQFYRAFDRYFRLKNNFQGVQPTNPTNDNTSTSAEPEPEPTETQQKPTADAPASQPDPVFAS